MQIDEIIEESGEPVFSFEFFPPKSEPGLATLHREIGVLRDPRFVELSARVRDGIESQWIE